MSPAGDGQEKGGAGGRSRSVVVGVKLDSASRELLTWALVKVAHPGDCVIALHVLSNNQIIDRDGKSSLLSLVKAFDSVLAVYEGFCNLKQVDLKLKICRGTSVRKIMVREAKSYEASTLMVGTAQKKHKIRSQASLAKYCARKLPRDCSVLAFNNGKIFFQRGSVVNPIDFGVEKSNSLLAAFHQSVSMKLQASPKQDNGDDGQEKGMFPEQGLLERGSQKTCSICSPRSSEKFSAKSAQENSFLGDEGGDNSMAIVPVQKLDAGSKLVTHTTKELPKLAAGWPLLSQAVPPGSSSRSSSSEISVVQWAMQLPSRQDSSVGISKSSEALSVCGPPMEGEKLSSLGEESGAIVAVENGVAPPLPALRSPADSWTSMPNDLEGFLEKFTATCRLFKYQELISVTSNFAQENLIGKGGNSQVYRGCLPNGKQLAVKVLKPSEDVLKEFILEIEITATLYHKNIISLFGFCYEDGNLIMIYDFLSRGSLEENLHGDKKDPHAFGWSERYKVALGVAEALHYLHQGSAQPVIHRDLKSSNILLSHDFEPQLCDFGLAKWASTASSHIVCSDVSGTFGYLAPEYFMYGKVNEKIDVYAFGVVLLELLTGRKPINSGYPKGQESLVMWANPILNGGKITQLLDQNLGRNYNQDQMEGMLLAANLCIRRSPRARPKMGCVLNILQGDAEVTKWARLQFNAFCDLEMLDSEACPRSDLQSHLNLALLDVEEDSFSMSSIEQGVSLEDYLKGRWSQSSSFD